jgi:ABC transport system ATP-binding/permease protein
VNYLSVENISKAYGSKTLFTKISFGISKGQRMGLIAKNGAGKSSLLKIISGEEIADEGKVTFRNNLSVTYLKQNPEFDENDTVEAAIYKTDNPTLNAVREYDFALEEFEKEMNDQSTARLEKATEAMNNMDAWQAEAKVKEVLHQLKIAFIHKKIGMLSGGQKKRVALAKALIDEPQLLIMDEPTNHLDVEMIEWLENYLINKDLTLLLVTHDRYFLDAVCNEMIEIDQKKLFPYKGNFQYYMEKKAEREEMEASEMDKTKNLYKRELEWVRKMPRARGTKSKSRVDAFQDIKEKVTAKQDHTKLELSVRMNRLGKKILELKNIQKAFGDTKIINDFSYIFKKGEKTGVVGKNGVGKSTFLNMVMELDQPDAGTITTGETIIYGYYSQEGIKLAEDKRVIDVVKDIAEYIPLADGSQLSASQLLTRFLFPADVQFSFVSKLSGGEKRRLFLMTILIKNPNFLILDEPTNDLDIVTLNVLEDFLTQFQGCVLIVTHDRYFMDKLVDHLFVFEGNGVVRDFPGNYSEYRERKELEEKTIHPPTSPSPKPENTAPSSTKQTLSSKERNEHKQLEKEIAKLEAEKETLTEKISNGIENHEEMMDCSQKIGTILAAIEEKSMRWLELSEGL